MADRLTQLQDCFDQLATQMFASIYYVNTHHAASPLPNQQFSRHFPSIATTSTAAPRTISSAAEPTTPAALPTEVSNHAHITTNNNTDNNKNTATVDTDPETTEDPDIPRPDTPTTFAAALHELSRDLVAKEQQIEYLIRSLPGIGRRREEQEVRLKNLEERLTAVEVECGEWEEEKKRLIKRVETQIWKVRRV